MTDTFESHAEGLGSPPSNAIAVVPNDSEDLTYVSRAINVATSGSVCITTLHGDTVTISVGAGTLFPVRARRIWTTGTTATGLVVMY